MHRPRRLWQHRLLGDGGIYALCRNELGRAREAASRGGKVINADAGPIDYAELGGASRSIHGAGGGFDQGLANTAEATAKLAPSMLIRFIGVPPKLLAPLLGASGATS